MGGYPGDDRTPLNPGGAAPPPAMPAQPAYAPAGGSSSMYPPMPQQGAAPGGYQPVPQQYGAVPQQGGYPQYQQPQYQGGYQQPQNQGGYQQLQPPVQASSPHQPPLYTYSGVKTYYHKSSSNRWRVCCCGLYCCLILGGVIFGFVALALWLRCLDADLQTTETFYPDFGGGEMGSLAIDLDDEWGKITILFDESLSGPRVDVETFSPTMDAAQKARITQDTSGGRYELGVARTDKSIWNCVRTEVFVSLPTALDRGVVDLDLDLGYGNVNINTGAFANVDIETDGGKVNIGSVDAAAFRISTDHGRVRFTSATSPVFDVRSEHGDTEGVISLGYANGTAAAAPVLESKSDHGRIIYDSVRMIDGDEHAIELYSKHGEVRAALSAFSGVATAKTEHGGDVSITGRNVELTNSSKKSKEAEVRADDGSLGAMTADASSKHGKVTLTFV